MAASLPKFGANGFWLRVGATASLAAVAVLTSHRLASAAFDSGSTPLGEIATTDGIVSGTVRMTGGRVAFYSGDKLVSTDRNLSLNFSSGGSLVLCPHSQMQVIATNQGSGVMLAFQAGGTEQPFPIHAGDVVMTPDWRVQMAGSVQDGDTGIVQISTNRHGALCLTGNTQPGSYFRASQMAGDASFDVPGQNNSVRLVDGRMENASGGCSCENDTAAGIANAALPPPAPVVMPQPAVKPVEVPRAMTTASVVPSSTPPPAVPPASSSSVAAPEPSQPVAAPSAQVKKRQHPEDVAGYVRSFLRLVFGR
jgi:hypothetical protein